MYISTGQAAERLGVTVRRIEQWIATNRIPARQVGGRWIIDERKLMRPEPRAAGRPRKER